MDDRVASDDNNAPTPHSPDGRHEAVEDHPGRSGLLGPGSMALALYGTIAAGLALAIGVDTRLGTAAVFGVVLAELGVFFIAHAYADTLGERYDHPDHRLSERVSHACRHDVMLLLGGLPILLVFGLCQAAGVESDLSADAALAAPIVLLGGFGYVAARRGRTPRSAALGHLVVRDPGHDGRDRRRTQHLRHVVRHAICT